MRAEIRPSQPSLQSCHPVSVVPDPLRRNTLSFEPGAARPPGALPAPSSEEGDAGRSHVETYLSKWEPQPLPSVLR